MKEWILSIGVVILLTSIVGLILPEGKIGKYIKCFFSFIILLVLLTPLLNKEVIYSDFLINENEIQLQENYLNYVYSKKIDTYKKYIQEIFDKNGISDIDSSDITLISSTKNNGEIIIEQIVIELNNKVIYSDIEHINIIEKIENNIKNIFENEVEVLIIYE